MQNLETKLAKAQATFDSLLSVSWWTLSDEDQEAYAESFKKASDEIEELRRRIAATREVRSMAKAMISSVERLLCSDKTGKQCANVNKPSMPT